MYFYSDRMTSTHSIHVSSNTVGGGGGGGVKQLGHAFLRIAVAWVVIRCTPSGGVGGGGGGVKQLGHAFLKIAVAWVVISCIPADETMSIVPGGMSSSVESIEIGLSGIDVMMNCRALMYTIPAIASFIENHVTVMICRKNKFTAIKHKTSGMPVYHQRSVVGTFRIHPTSV
jgi:hypothetical protein